MIDRYCDDLVAHLEAEISMIQNTMGRGNCGEFHSYREMVGRIAGLRRAADRARELLVKHTEEEDSDSDDGGAG